MTQIVGIHGISQEFNGRFGLEKIWLPPMRDGLAAAGYHTAATALTDQRMRVAFFGDLFRPAGTMGGQDFPYEPSDIRPGLELDLLTELYRAALAEENSLSDQEPGTADSMSGGRVVAQVMVERLLRTRTFARITRHAFVGSLKQVVRFLSDQPTKERVLERVREALHDDTQVLIGHSMGSIVAYESLCRYQPPSIRLLITLGSPLGIRNIIFDRLTPGPIHGRGVWPGNISTWINVADPNDVVALRKELSTLWDNSIFTHTISDRKVNNGKEPHSVVRYLNSRQTGAALGDVLGD